MSTEDEVQLEASAAALSDLTTKAGEHPADPKAHIQAAADEHKSHSFLSRFFPSQQQLECAENWFHMGNYVIDRSTLLKEWEAMSIYVRTGMHLLYYGRAQEKLLQTKRVEALLRDQSMKMGKQYDDPASVNHIQPFIDSFNLGPSMVEMVQPDPKQYKNFNEFFAREIREDARPIDEPDNDLVTSSPADCRLTTFPTVEAATKFWVKGQGFTLSTLLGGMDLGRYFEDGSMAIARLAPQDYHRWHSPVSGTVETIREIDGTYYTVNPQAINQPGVVNVFCQNRRSVMIIRRNATGSRIAIVAVGAMLVGSIRYQPDVEDVGAQVRRGQCLGAFYYGGSTVIVVYPKDEVQFDEDLVRHSIEQNCETLVRVGWRIGIKN